MHARRFREDLYYRLRVVELVIPPLRDRPSDLPMLAEHMVARAAESLGMATPVLAPAAMNRLLENRWPGNVRELENCVQHMAAINSGPLLHLGDLPSNLRNYLTEKKSQYLMAAAGTDFSGAPKNDVPGDHAAGGSPMMQNAPVVVPLLELERRAIVNALEYTKGDRSVAAHLLGIGRTTLYRKLKEYQLET